MESLDSVRDAFGCCVAMAMLAGCGGSQPPIGGGVIQNSTSSTKTFHYTGHKQTFVVPSGVNQIDVAVLGASGGSCVQSLCVGGNGGRVAATVPVTPGEKLAIFVGGNGLTARWRF